MNEKFIKLTTKDIVLSILKYKEADENSNTKNYFILGSEEFPVMRIVKEAMIINGSFEQRDYDDFSACKQILEKRLNLSSRDFI
jgi:hypothetical protein